MSGFENDVVFAKNADFSQLDNQAPVEANGLATNGQLWIGTTSVNAGGTHINVGAITSPDSSLTVGFSTPNITLQVAGGSTVGKTITGDSGGALSPTSGNWNILGRSGSKTSGSGSTLTISSPPYSDQGGSTTVVLNSGSFATAAITLTLPASAGLSDGDLVEFICTTAGALIIQAVGTQQIRIGNQLSGAAGSATSTAVGDFLRLRFRATDGFWYSTGSVGNWLLV